MTQGDFIQWAGVIAAALFLPISVFIDRRHLLFLFLASLALWNFKVPIHGYNIKVFQMLLPFVALRYLPTMLANFRSRGRLPDVLMLALTGVFLASFSYTVDTARTLHVVLVLLPLIFIYFLLRLGWRDREDRRHILDSLLFGATLVMLYGLCELLLVLFGVDLNQYVHGRLQATFNEPNWLGNYICFVLPIAALVFLFGVPTFFSRNILAALIFLLCLELLLSYTRGAWVALAGVTLVFGFVERRYLERIVKLMLVGALLLGALLFIENMLPGKLRLSQRLLNVTSAEYGTTGGYRWMAYRETVRLAFLLPDVTWRGYGLGTWGEVYTNWDPTHEQFAMRGVENAYADLLFSTGIAGLALFLVTMGYPLGRFWARLHALKRQSETRYRLALAYALALLAQMLSIFISNSLTFPFLWVNLALLVNEIYHHETDAAGVEAKK